LTTSQPLPKSVSWEAGELYLLDQTRLPHHEVMIHCQTVAAVFDAISCLRVRGAPAIGITAAYGLLVEATAQIEFIELQRRARYLVSARPTAVNLAWALERMMTKAESLSLAGSISRDDLLQEALAIHEEDRKSCQAIGDFGLPLLQGKQNLLTHCNAGSLAVSEYGTALAPIYRAVEQGQVLHVYVDETRPLLQGARLTSFELARHGVDHTLITDNMAAHVMSLGKVDAVIVGTDRVTANGDVANKIGTLNLAILCQYFNIPFYVACPTSTIDLRTPSGADIDIECRAADEVRKFSDQLTCLADTPVFNPAFDVTPAALVTALITDRGVIHRPDSIKLASGGFMTDKQYG
jgi:methylthioribose-1-phosphate isomerase